MSGSGNRKAGIKVSGLVASGRVQVRDIIDQSDMPKELNQDSGSSERKEVSAGLQGPVVAPTACDVPVTQVANTEAGISNVSSVSDQNAEGATASTNQASPASQHLVSSSLIVPPSSGDGSAVEIPLTDVVDSPYQPRLQYNPEEIDHLAETMREATQGEPIRVRVKNGKYELISGHRRVRAARSLGWTEIAAYVEVLTDAEAQAKTMVLAVGSVHLTDYELAKMFDTAIVGKLCKNQRAVASYFGFGTTKVNGCMDMLKLPRSIVRFLDARPDLFGYETAIVIKKLYAEYPDHLADLERGVQRLTEGATQGSLKAWVLQAIKGQAISSTGGEPNLITSGRRLAFTTKVNADKRAIQVSCKLPEVDLAVLEKDLQAWLEERAKALSPEAGD